MDQIRDHSPNHRHVTVTDLQVRLSSDCRRSVSIGHLLLTISSKSSRSWSQRSPPCQPLAQCFWLASRCRHLSCVVPLIDLSHGRRRWRSRWSLAVHFEINLLGRFAERRLRIALRWGLDRRGRRCGLFLWWLAEAARVKTAKKMNTPPEKTLKPAGCHFLPKQPMSAMISPTI